MHDVLRPEPAADKPMPHGLETRVRRIQNDLKNDGHPVSDDEALKLLSMSDLCLDDLRRSKFRADLALAENKAFELGYSDDDATAICDYIKRHGTVWGCETLEESSRAEHAEAIEAIVVAYRELDVPPKRDDYKAIRQILEDEGCEPRFINRVLAIAKAHGTVECDKDVLKMLKAEVRQKVESAIPGVSPWQWDADFGEVSIDRPVFVPIRDENGRRTYAGSTGYDYLADRGGAGYGTWND